MFSLSELAPLNQHQSRCKLLKPWWEVFMDYLVVLMLMASVLACTEQYNNYLFRYVLLKDTSSDSVCH
uniref:LRRC8 pannexin-like TM region domain-containing protein n=1 Tax=Mastacembelus armatus TaxID=205130 RepID=A0A7N8WYU7_9TELE